jgi:hypothetical protein
MTDTVVSLELWHDKVYGNRCSVIWQGRTLLTFGTEAEAREAAERHGWMIDAGDGLERGR